jgi:hypothetical protein
MGRPTNGDEAGAINVGPVVNGTLLSTFIDPFESDRCNFGTECELTELNEQLTKRANVFLGCDVPSRENENPAQCNRLNAPEGYFHITMSPMFKVIRQSIAARDVVSPAACTSSICYRAPAPYLFGVRIGDGTDESRLIMMPNEAPIMAMDLPTGVFASAKARVDLVHGMPAAVGISQDSELLQIVAIPLNVIDGFFRGVGQVFSIRIAYDNSKVSMLQSNSARREAERAYNEKWVRDTSAELRAAEAELEALKTKTYSSDPAGEIEYQNDTRELRARIEEAEAANAAAISQRDEDLERFALEDVNGGGDEAGTINEFIDAVPDSDGEGGVASAQQARITLLDETQRMFNLNVVESPAARDRARTVTTSNPGSNTGSAEMTIPSDGITVIDPDAANEATDEE